MLAIFRSEGNARRSLPANCEKAMWRAPAASPDGEPRDSKAAEFEDCGLGRRWGDIHNAGLRATDGVVLPPILPLDVGAMFLR